MAKFTVYADEVIWYEIEVEADSKHEALEKVFNMNITQEHIVGGDNFTIERIEEKENA